MDRPIKFGSVCSGIEAASVAWMPLGWKAAWLAEIELFPSAVLAHHYPNVPNLGDMTALPERITSGEVEAPDIFCGGTPCQAFSVAGLRNSLTDERGGLTLKFVEIANAIDAVRVERGEYECIVFWENVPGVLNTKDNAFGCFLAGLAGEDEPLVAPGGKWTNAGCVFGPQRAVAWRVLDAQYFGVAQRRRRVFVVASARKGFDPAAVLFESEGVRRDTAPRREAGEVAPTIPSRSTAGGGLGTDFDLDGGVIEAIGVTIHGTHPTVQKIASYDEVAQCLRARTPGNIDNSSTTVVQQPIITMAPGQGGAEIGFDCGPTLTCNHEAPIAVYAIQAGALRTNPNSGPDGIGVQANHAYTLEARAEVQAVCITGDITHTLKAEGFDASEDGTGRGTPLVPHVVGPLACNTGPNGHDAGNFACNQAVDAGHVLPVAFAENSRGEMRLEGGDGQRTGALSTGGGKPGQGVPMICFPATLSGTQHASTENLAPSLGAANPVGVFYAGQGAKAGSIAYSADVAPTLKASDSGTNRVPSAHIGMQVRRLTPVECEKLQGFLPGHTAIPWRKKPADQCPDGPRYRALGNSWAVPVVSWIGRRIQQHLASL